MKHDPEGTIVTVNGEKLTGGFCPEEKITKRTVILVVSLKADSPSLKGAKKGTPFSITDKDTGKEYVGEVVSRTSYPFQKMVKLQVSVDSAVLETLKGEKQ